MPGGSFIFALVFVANNNEEEEEEEFEEDDVNLFVPSINESSRSNKWSIINRVAFFALESPLSHNINHTFSMSFNVSVRSL